MLKAKTIDRQAWEQVTRTLQENPNVMAAWVFGSAQDGHVRPSSDVDIALLFDIPPDLDELITLRMAVQDALHFDAIDIVTLHGASAITRFEVVSGRLLFCRDKQQMAAFVSLTAREYEDVMGMLQKALSYRTSS